MYSFFYIAIGMIIILVPIFLIKIIFRKAPKLMSYLPSIGFLAIGLVLVARYLYYTFTGVYALCEISPGCMNEDFSIVIGYVAIGISFFAFIIGWLINLVKPRNNNEEIGSKDGSKDIQE